MYTDGKIIIEKKHFTIQVISITSEVIYMFKTENEAHETFINLILENEKNKNLLL